MLRMNQHILDSSLHPAAIIDPVAMCGVHIAIKGGEGNIDHSCLLRPPARNFSHPRVKLAIHKCQPASNCASLRLQSHLAALSRSARGAAEAAPVKVGSDAAGVTQAALNSTPSVAQCGTYGPGQAKLWALSQIETLHLWDWCAAADEEVPGEHYESTT